MTAAETHTSELCPPAVGGDDRPARRESNRPSEDCFVALSRYPGGYLPGRRLLVRAAWYVTSLLVFESGWVPLRGLKRFLLRRFGAMVGEGVVIKPRVRIKYPWRLRVGDHVWIGEEAWIDNIADVQIGGNVCLSQGSYLCTGSHDHRSPTFDLQARPICIHDGAWICARAIVLAGVTIGANAVVSAGSVVRQDVPSRAVVAGNPAQTIGERSLR